MPSDLAQTNRQLRAELTINDEQLAEAAVRLGSR